MIAHSHLNPSAGRYDQLLSGHRWQEAVLVKTEAIDPPFLSHTNAGLGVLAKDEPSAVNALGILRVKSYRFVAMVARQIDALSDL